MVPVPRISFGRDLRIDTVRWAVGAYSAVIGSLMLVAPHQFATPAFAAVQPALPFWGTASLMAGVGLISAAVFPPRLPLMLAIHLATGMLGLELMASFVGSGAWSLAAIYGIMGLGTGVAPLLPGARKPGPGPADIDLFTLLLAGSTILTGLTLTVTDPSATLGFDPARLSVPAFDATRPSLPAFGALFVLAGVALASAEVQAMRWPIAAVAVRLFVATSYLIFLAYVGLAYHHLPVIVMCGFGLVVALLPWLRAEALNLVDPQSLRTRLALVLAISAALPLVLSAVLVAEQAEKLALEGAERAEEMLAATLASAVADYVGLHHAAVIALAAETDPATMDSDDHRHLLRVFGQAYPEVLSFSSYDQTGRRIARSEDPSSPLDIQLPALDESRRTGAPALVIGVHVLSGRPLFGLSAPVRGPDGRFAGGVVGVLDSERVGDLLARQAAGPGRRAYLVDTRGRLTGRWNLQRFALLSDLSGVPPVAAALTSGASGGSLVHAVNNEDRLAAYARVPTYGWIVVGEEPLAATLAGVRAGRETTFAVLLLAVALAAGAGWLVAGRLAAPVTALAAALQRFGVDDVAGPLPAPQTREFAQVAAAFADMRDRLASASVERLRTEETLRASEERYRRVFETAQEGILMIDENLVITLANHKIGAMLGYTPAEMVGRPLFTFMDEEGQAISNAHLELRRRGVADQFESKFRRRDGTVMWCIVSGAPVIGPDGVFEGALAMIMDISDRKLMGEQLLRAQRLETAGRIASQVAHDFNNLLAPLAGYPELIKMRLPPDHPAVGFCDAMLQAARQMAEISEDLLALGRRGHFDHEPIHVEDLIRAVLTHMGDIPATLKVDLRFARDLLPIAGAPAQLHRVLANLLWNAREAMVDDGRLTLSAANIYVDQPLGLHTRVPVGEYVRIDVADTGPGIPDDVIQRVFDVFFTTKMGARRGSGLGLSIVQTIMEDHEGHVDLETRPGRGTTFSLYFPVSREPVAASTPYEARGGTESILVVDDDPVQREVARNLLETLGYQVSLAASGEEAVAKLRAQPADLLILDMIMDPGIDGAETYRRVAEMHPGQAAIIVSGYAESKGVKRAQSLGAGAYIRKPVTLEKLAHAVREEIARHPGATPGNGNGRSGAARRSG